LLDEGFEADAYIDIFDGGPTAESRISTLRSVQHNRRLRVKCAARKVSAPHIIATTSTEGFRATIADAAVEGNDLLLSPELADALEVAEGDSVRAVALNAGASR
jgi:arginine N-succinyltransferase